MQGVGFPHGPREARLWNYFNTGELFWKIAEWPPYLRGMIMRAHKERVTRWLLMAFLTGNGLDPTIAHQWVAAMDFRDGQLINGDYDNNAVRHFHELSEQARDGLLQREASFYDMTWQRVNIGTKDVRYRQ